MTQYRFIPMTGDGDRAKAVLAEIQAGRLKGDLARKLMQQARIDDLKTDKGGQP